MDKSLTEKGYRIIWKNTGNSQKNEARALDDILTKNIDGLIIEPSKSEIYCRHMHLYESLDRLRIPYVFIQGTYPQMKGKPSIIMDDVQGSYGALDSCLRGNDLRVHNPVFQTLQCLQLDTLTPSGAWMMRSRFVRPFAACIIPIITPARSAFWTLYRPGFR